MLTRCSIHSMGYRWGMRWVLGAFYAGDPERVAAEAVRSAQVTHIHPEGVLGAVAVALAAGRAAHARPDRDSVHAAGIHHRRPRPPGRLPGRDHHMYCGRWGYRHNERHRRRNRRRLYRRRSSPRSDRRSAADVACRARTVARLVRTGPSNATAREFWTRARPKMVIRRAVSVISRSISLLIGSCGSGRAGRPTGRESVRCPGTGTAGKSRTVLFGGP